MNFKKLIVILQLASLHAGAATSFCDKTFPGGSLGSLLFNSDNQLRQYSENFNSKDDKILEAQNYLHNLLSVIVDANGDGGITRTEMVSALKIRSISSSAFPNIKLWCQTTIPDSFCYGDSDPDLPQDVVLVNDIFNDAVNNFLTSSKHFFDGSGVDIISDMMSTFPQPSWTTQKCKKYDNSWSEESTALRTDWTYVGGVNPTRVCAYSNGALQGDLTNTATLSLTQSSFVDSDVDTSNQRYKRIYCISMDYAVNAYAVTTKYECSIGLLYDGTPIDLVPELTEYGVVFSYLDTSSSESKFEIFVGDQGSDISEKNLVAGINYPSMGCGKVNKNISFVDKKSIEMVGQTREYAIRAIQTTKSSPVESDVTSVTVMPYRIPFYVQVSGTVKTGSGTGVENVKVSFCHIDPATGLNDVREAFCPLQMFMTDKRGRFQGEIRVSDPNWTNLVEYFNVTAEKIDVMPSGEGVSHQFLPPSQILSLSHSIGKVSTSIIDKTSVALTGYVRLDPINVGGNDCPLAGVPVNLLKSNGEVKTVISAPDGFYQFTIIQGEAVQVYISDFPSNSWNTKLGSTSSNITQPTAVRFTSSTAKSTMTITIDQKGGEINVAEIQFLRKSIVLGSGIVARKSY